MVGDTPTAPGEVTVRTDKFASRSDPERVSSAPEITPAVVQYSAGASEHLLIAQVINLVQTIRQLQEAGVWVAGLDLDDVARPLHEVDLNLPLAIVVGHEGEGLRRLVRERCDF